MYLLACGYEAQISTLERKFIVGISEKRIGKHYVKWYNPHAHSKASGTWTSNELLIQ